jgi:hypothetical protein
LPGRIRLRRKASAARHDNRENTESHFLFHPIPPVDCSTCKVFKFCSTVSIDRRLADASKSLQFVESTVATTVNADVKPNSTLCCPGLLEMRRYS